MTFSQYLTLIKSPETTPDVAILWDFAPYPSIGQTLWRTWSTSAVGLSNFARYSNPEVDRLLSEGRGHRSGGGLQELRGGAEADPGRPPDADHRVPGDHRGV